MRREVRPVLTKGAHKSVLHTASPATYHFENRGQNRVSTYSQETSDFTPVPLVAKNKAPVHEANDIMTHKIKVSLEDKASAKLSFEDLPEISLQGDLAIVSLDDSELFEDTEPVTADQISFTPQAVRVSPVTVTKRYQSAVTSHNRLRQEVSQNHTVPSLPLEPINTPPDTQHAPERVVVIESPKVQSVSFLVVPFLMLIALLVSLLLLGLQSSAETDGVTLNQMVTFSWQTALDSLYKILQSY
jgi:hypothetical protein